MESYYEVVQVKDYMPMNLFVHSTNNFMMHIHKEMEIILVLEGSINIKIDDNNYLLRENDFILINSGQAHSTSKTNEKNTCLVFQLDPFYFENYYPIFSKINIDCKSLEYGGENQEKFDMVRQHLAKTTYVKNKKAPNYQLDIGSETLQLIKSLLDNFQYTINEDDSYNGSGDNIRRIKKIIKYIYDNIVNDVTLDEVARNEDVSVYHLSRFIKKNLGMNFQDYKNHKRLDLAVSLLNNTEDTITSIALQSGFPSVKSLNNVFKRYYDCTPSNYRLNYIKLVEGKKLDRNFQQKISNTYLDVDRTAAFAKLYTYLDDKDKDEDEEIYDSKSIEVKVDMETNGVELDHYWTNLTTFGRASEGLREGWRKQFRELQREIGFKNVRFHGIFHDDMMIYNVDDDNVVYNWTYVDDLFDFFMEIKVKPFIELGFMPEELKSADRYIYWWKANVSQPKDIDLWTDLVKEFVKHCIGRYGLEEVESWYFELWNEPELEEIYWIGTREEYFEFYKSTVLAIKSMSKKIKVGGPSITHEALKHGTWLDDFLNYCVNNSVPLDILTMHIYPESFSKDDAMIEVFYKFLNGEDISELIQAIPNTNFLSLVERVQSGEDPFEVIKDSSSTSGPNGIKKIYYEKDHTSNTLKDLNKKLEDLLPSIPEIHIVEWSSTAFGRNLISDTCYTSTFIIKNVIDSIGLTNSLGYWTFTDIMEEFKAGIGPFHGGFGLINNQGLKKPGYYAYYLLSKLGNEIIHQEEDFIVTRQGEDVQILAYNYAYFDNAFMQGDTSALTHEKRYEVFEGKNSIKLKINLIGLEGQYKVTRYKLDRDHGSVFDQWQRMGSPVNMTKEEINYLKAKSQPTMTVENIKIEKEFKHSLQIPIHGVELMIMEKTI